MKMVHEHTADTLAVAAKDLAAGKCILLHDSGGRENEVDMVFSALSCTPSAIEFMRSAAGGLICAAVGNEVAAKVGLPFMHDLLMESAAAYPVFSKIAESTAPYGGRPAFSITLNHRNSFTGVTDRDRSMTVMAIGRVAELSSDGSGDPAAEFVSSLKSPGHVPLLIEAGGSTSERRGHTELSIKLMRMAGLPPASVVCEMLDGRTHLALGLEDARKFASDRGLALVEGKLL